MSHKIFGRWSSGDPTVTHVRSKDQLIAKSFNKKESKSHKRIHIDYVDRIFTDFCKCGERISYRIVIWQSSKEILKLSPNNND